MNKYIIISILLLSFLFLGCTESNIVLPYTSSQFISQSTDLNYSLFVSGVYDGNFLMFDGNKLSVGAIDINSYDIDWNNLINFPSGCPENSAVKIVGSSLVCVDLPVDTNFETFGFTADDINNALIDLSGYVPFTGANQDVNLGLNDFIVGDDEGYSVLAGGWGFNLAYVGNLVMSVVNGYLWNDSGDIFARNIYSDSNVVVDGNVSASYLFGDGSNLTGMSVFDTNWLNSHPQDNEELIFGTVDDYKIKWDGTNAVHALTSGDIVFNGNEADIVLNNSGNSARGEIGTNNLGAYLELIDATGTSNILFRSYGDSYINGGDLELNVDTVNIITQGSVSSNRGLDIYNGAVSFVLGGDPNANTRTDSTIKYGRMGIPHYLNAEQPAAIFLASSASATNVLDIGGGSSYFNAMTKIAFYTASNTTTTTGTTKSYIDPNGLHFDDGFDLRLGTVDDASIKYDGTNLLINPQVVGSGKTVFTGSAIIPTLYGDTNPASYLSIAGQTSLISRGNLIMGADEDGSGAGSLSLKTKGIERVNISNNGNVHIISDLNVDGNYYVGGIVGYTGDCNYLETPIIHVVGGIIIGCS